MLYCLPRCVSAPLSHTRWQGHHHPPLGNLHKFWFVLSAIQLLNIKPNAHTQVIESLIELNTLDSQNNPLQVYKIIYLIIYRWRPLQMFNIKIFIRRRHKTVTVNRYSFYVSNVKVRFHRLCNFWHAAQNVAMQRFCQNNFEEVVPVTVNNFVEIQLF